uniref:DNA methyltransferase 1-associated protein 1 n=1 Tax=Ascaris suum TaxID=6253 RepID=F1KXY2_ASCSU
MNTADAQDILGWNATPKDEGILPIGGLTDVDRKKRSNRAEAHFKRPEGMHRELFNLLAQDSEKNLAALIPSTTKNLGYRNQKARIGMRQVRPWVWKPFENPARVDGLQLCHWQRVDKIEAGAPYPFARFNKVINIPTFTDDEYDKHLKSLKWSKEDTLHLFDLCTRFDLRWPIIVDRWEGSTRRTMEEMKERFYNAVNELNSSRDPSAELLCYDAEHEKRRKEQLIKQWNRTPQEIEEEEMLIAEMRKIEVRKRERERKAQDLQKLITASDRTPTTPANTSSALSPAAGVKKKSVIRPKASTANIAHSASTSFIAEHSSLRFPEFRSAGAHLRSQEMKLPTNVGQKKLKNIETVIEKLKLDLVPVGAEEIVVGYNEFRSSIVLLQELKHALQTAEYELESLRTRYQAATGKTFEIEPRMRVSSMGDSSMFGEDKEGTNSGLPSSTRTITDMIELSSSLPQAVRKRKATAPTNTTPAETRRLRRS